MMEDLDRIDSLCQPDKFESDEVDGQQEQAAGDGRRQYWFNARKTLANVDGLPKGSRHPLGCCLKRVMRSSCGRDT